jgi:hypothetical protein
MEPVLIYYINLALCGIVSLELLVTFRKNPVLKIYFLLIVVSLFVMNYFAITGIETKIAFIFARFMRLVYVAGTLLAIIHIAEQKIPKWIAGLIAFSAVFFTSLRVYYYDQINIKALPNIPNHVFSVGGEFYSPKPGPRYLGLALSMVAIGIAYYYYRRLLMKLDIDLPQHKHLSRWIISLVLPFFLLTIFGILGNLQIFDSTLSSYLFALFGCITICSFVFRPRFLDTGNWDESLVRLSVKPA